MVIDIANPASPREVFRLRTPDTFNPHWLARDPQSNRLVLGAELGGEEGYFILRFDDQNGQLAFDPAFGGEGQAGYISLKQPSWPHGASGAAWGHAALFLPPSFARKGGGKELPDSCPRRTNSPPQSRGRPCVPSSGSRSGSSRS